MTKYLDRSQPEPHLPAGNVPRILRTPLRKLSLGRLLRGGRPEDLGRLPRYAAVFLIGASLIWAPILGYLSTAPLRYTSQTSLILPGSGASASVNLDEIGQASSFASSAFSNGSVSPTVTYKRLLGADRILDAAAAAMGTDLRAYGQPRVELVDQTGLIRIEVTGNSAADLQERGDALLAAFFSEVNALRADELAVREDSARGAIEEYRLSVASTRDEISALQRETGLISAEQYHALVTDTEALRALVSDKAMTLVEKTEAVNAYRVSLGVEPELAAATLKLHADTEFLAIIVEMSDNAARLAEAEGRYGPRHPERRDALGRHVAARDRAWARAADITRLPPDQLARLDLSPIGGRAELLSRLVRLGAERTAAVAELAAMRERLAEMETRIGGLIEPAARLEDLQRNFAVAEAIFASAMARTQTSKTDLYASYPLVQVLENPSLPGAPSSPRRKLAIAAGGAATLFFLIGLGLGWIRRPLIGRILADPAARQP